MFFGHWEIVLLLLAVVLLFGTGRISALMGDVAKGIKSFKKGMSDDGGSAGSKSTEALENATSEREKADPDNSKS